MSHATERQVRRATRKLLGDQGRQIVELQSATLNSHADALLRLQLRMNALEAALKKRPETFVQRAKYLLTGQWAGHVI